MKITSFDPMIITKDQESLVALFEALGFERRHQKDAIDEKNISSVRMKLINEDGKTFHMDVASAENLPRDLQTIRMNVRDFEEAYEFLKSKGFINPQGDHIVESASAKSCLLISPTGFSIQLTQHIKE